MTAVRREYPPYISYLIATLMSVSMLAYQATLPFKLQALGGGLDSVGFLFTWTSFWYIMAGLFLGWISHHAGPRRVMLATLAICGVIATLLPFTNAIWQVFLASMIYLIAMCLFWAAMEHASTGLHTHLTLIQSTAAFCVAFSIGNSIGQMTSSLFQARTLAVPFLVSAGVMVIVFVLTWLTVSPEAGFRRSSPQDIAAFPEQSRHRLRRSLLASRTGLVGAYGVYGLTSMVLPRYLAEYRDFSKPLAGTFPALMLLTMAVTFALHGRWRAWPHRLWMIRLCPFLAAGCALIVGLVPAPGLIAIGAVLVGVIAATAYSHNLYYSLEEPGTRARNAGIHEAVVGLAFMIPQALGGLATRWTKNPESIFWAGAGLAMLAGIVQNIALLVTGRRSASA